MVVSKLMNEVASAIFKRNLQSYKFLLTNDVLEASKRHLRLS